VTTTKKPTVIILHGIGGHAGKHWMQWLHDRLKDQKFEVVMPTLPDPEHPAFTKWRAKIRELIQDKNPSWLIFVAHSMGVPAALNVIQELKHKVLGLISVAGFYRDYGAELNSYFMQDCITDITKAREKIKNSAVFYGDNDPYVPQETLAELAAGLGVKPFIIKDGGHLNTDAGFTAFPELLETISGWSS
jgi:predicted alpha/beta hydrolase family esterase